MLHGRIDRHMHEWSLIPVGGTGRVVSTPNRRVDQCSGRANLPWLLPGPVLWTVPQEALIGLDPEYISSTLKTTLAKVRQPRPSRLEYLRRRCLLRRRQASFISTSISRRGFRPGRRASGLRSRPVTEALNHTQGLQLLSCRTDRYPWRGEWSPLPTGESYNVPTTAIHPGCLQDLFSGHSTTKAQGEWTPLPAGH